MILTTKFFLNKTPRILYKTYLINNGLLEPLAEELVNSQRGNIITISPASGLFHSILGKKLVTINKQEFLVTKNQLKLVETYCSYTTYEQVKPIIEYLKNAD